MSSRSILVTVADDRSGRKNGLYGKTQDIVENIFKSHPNFGFTDYLMLKWEDIKKSNYYNTYSNRLDIVDPQYNGRIYKPLAIKEALSLIIDGDFLVYNDVSPELWMSIDKINWDLYDLNILRKLCHINSGILTAHAEFDHDGIKQRQIGWPNIYNYDAIGHHTHEIFTSKECRQIMDADNKYLYCLQHASGFIALIKNEKSIKFIDEWIYYSTIPECCEISKTEPHRTDQSISGILINKMGNKLIRCLLGQHQYTIINPYNLLSFSQLKTNYTFVDSIQQKQSKEIYIDNNKNKNKDYQNISFSDNWCVRYR